MNPALEKYYQKHKENPQGLRFGQRFVNDFIIELDGDYSYLFYCVDDEKAKVMAEEYLTDHHYFDHLPVRVYIND
jgi:hypothetical protein